MLTCVSNFTTFDGAATINEDRKELYIGKKC